VVDLCHTLGIHEALGTVYGPVEDLLVPLIR